MFPELPDQEHKDLINVIQLFTYQQAVKRILIMCGVIFIACLAVVVWIVL